MSIIKTYIAVKRTDGKWESIHCHRNGGILDAGRILFDNYTSQSKAEALVALGDLSSLGPELGKRVDMNQDLKKIRQAQCIAYRRDGTGKVLQPCISDTVEGIWPAEGIGITLFYLWCDVGDGPKWWVAAPEGSVAGDLGAALVGDVIPTVIRRSAFGLN